VRRPFVEIALVLAAGGALIFAACEQLPEWPVLEAPPGVQGAAGTTSTGAAGTSGAAGAQGAAGTSATGAAGVQGAAGAAAGTGASGSAAGTSGAAGGAAAGTGSNVSGAAGTQGGAAGTSGAAGAGAAGTSGAAGAMAGTGGQADALAEARLALANLDNFTWTKTCKFSDSGKDVTTLSGCQAADICWETADLGRTFESKTIAINGVAGHTYKFDLRLRGVLEPRDYPVAPNCTRLPNMPADTIGVSECQDGYANKSQVTFNVMELAIPMPAHKYYVNSVKVHPPHRVDKADWKWTVTVAANQTIKFTYDDLNGGMIRNCTNSITGTDVVVKQQPFNGQWFQLNVDYSTLMIVQ
jgi:hypothetical protein